MTTTVEAAIGRFDLRVQPMVHVAELARSIDFYERLGGTLVFGSRDGDWALLRFGDTALSLLARPSGPANPEPVELQFVSGTDLDTIETHLRETDASVIERGVADEMFGRMLQLRTQEGLVVKLLELERELIA